ncbi:MAG: IS110 family transposase, partial [Lachnospiraceae bacterium]|nr:IS110 family transposase [Lachnospiraceae bacterium]
LLTTLESLNSSCKIKIGFEATGHYTSNLKRFLENAHYSFMESNPALISKYIHSQTLRKTKNDSIDSRSIAHWLMTVEYKPYPIGFYHTYSLKSLTRLRDTIVRQRSLYMVKLTNVLDHIFPEFKPFFKEKFSKTALFILEKYHTPERISRMNSASYDSIRCSSRGKFSMQRFIELKALALNTVGDSNEIFEMQLISLLNLYHLADSEVARLESEITALVIELNPKALTIPGIGPISAAVIASEYGDISKFSSPSQMLSFAGLEPGYYQSGTSEFHGKMVKRGSSQLRYVLMNCTMPLIMYNMVFAEYYHKKRNEGKPHRVALSHVAKKLIRIIYTLETKNIPFDAAMLR